MRNSNTQHKERRTSVPNILPGQLRLLASCFSLLIDYFVAMYCFPAFWRHDLPTSHFLASRFPVFLVSGVAISLVSRACRRDFVFFFPFLPWL